LVAQDVRRVITLFVVGFPAPHLPKPKPAEKAALAIQLNGLRIGA